MSFLPTEYHLAPILTFPSCAMFYYDLLSAYMILSQHVKQVNLAESVSVAAAYGQDGISGDSADILGYDCGGQQLVFEVCFPCGYLDGVCLADNRDKTSPGNVDRGGVVEALERKEAVGEGEAVDGSYANLDASKDLVFVYRLLEAIEKEGIPAHSPIEQR